MPGPCGDNGDGQADSQQPEGQNDAAPPGGGPPGRTGEATPSALTGGNAFTVTWDSSGAAAIAPAAAPAAASPS